VFLVLLTVAAKEGGLTERELHGRKMIGLKSPTLRRKQVKRPGEER